MSRAAHQRMQLVLVDPRELMRACLSSWLRTLGCHFEVIGVPDLDKSLQADVLARASMVLINGIAPMPSEDWLQDRIEWLHANVADVPVVVIADSADGRITEMLAGRRCLQGYIPSSSSRELAEATVRIVVAGGTYVPRILNDVRPSTQVLHQLLSTPPEPSLKEPPSAAKLTRRERSVLDLLQRGMPNKMIGHRLDMSHSTVKAHVHNIIAKLNVRNRTEAAMSARGTTLVVPSLGPAVSGRDRMPGA